MFGGRICGDRGADRRTSGGVERSRGVFHFGASHWHLVDLSEDCREIDAVDTRFETSVLAD